MITKEQLLKSIQELPDRFSIDEILDRIVLLDKIQRGLTQSRSGQTHSTEDARKLLSKWSK